MNKRIAHICLLSVLAIFGCSDGSDRRADTEFVSPAAGIYAPGTYKPTGVGVIMGNAEALVSPAGELWLLMGDGPWFDDVPPAEFPYLISGPITIDGNNVSAPSLRVFPDGRVDPAAMTAVGEFVENEYLSATYSWGDQTGDFVLSYSDLNEGIPALETLANVWSVTIGFVSGGGSSFNNLVVTLTVYDDGTAFGSDTSGCTFSGDFALISPEHNFYDVDLELSSCGERDGSYEGLAFIRNCCGSEPTGRVLSVATANESRSFSMRLFGSL